MDFACPVCGDATTAADGAAACGNGHRYDAETFELEKALQSIRALWIAARALQEHAASLRWSARNGIRAQDPERLDEQAANFEAYATTVRDLIDILEARKLPDEAGLRLQSRVVEQHAVITCNGEIDLVGTPRLRSEFERLAAEGARTVLLDLTLVSFIDSSGLGVIMRGHKLFNRFALRGLNERTRVAFVATGLAPAIEVEE